MRNEIHADLAEIRRALALLCEPGEVYELRALGTSKGTVSGYFDDSEKLVGNAAGCSDRLQADGVYLTLNPVKRDLLARASNRLEGYAKHTSADLDIVARRWLGLDFDPVRPAGISSTDEEHNAALERAMTARETLAGLGWPAPIFSDSGNGAHLLYRIDLPTEDASRELLRRILDSLDSLLSDEVVAVDKTTFNAARIWKLYGTVARKGDSTVDRPHRLARILDAPEVLQIVTPEQLDEIARMLPKPEPLARSNSTTQSSFNLESWIATHGIEVARESAWAGGQRWILRRCLFDESHGGSSVAILRLASGAIVYRCLHNSCASRTWHDARELFEPGYRERHSGGMTHNSSVPSADCDAIEPILGEAAKLSAFDFAVQKKPIRAKLKAAGADVTLKALETEVERRRERADESKDLLLPESAQDPEPWLEPVNGAELLNEIRNFLQRFVIVEQHAYTALALWIAFTYMLDIAICAIRIAFVSATKRCGKTRAMEVLGMLCRRVLASSNMSPAAVYRTIDALGDASCTLLIDEADTFVGKPNGNSDLVGILNAAFDRAHAFVTRAVPVGDKQWESKRFGTWAAIAYAFNLAKGRIPDTWLDRSIAIRMHRKRTSEKTQPLRLSNHAAFAEAFEIRRKLVRWANDMGEQLREADPYVPETLNDRAADGWHPIFAIAEAAGGPWPALAWDAATAICPEAQDGSDDSLSIALLSDIRDLFDERNTGKLASQEICDGLIKLEGRAWAEYGKRQKPISKNQLARLLATFQIEPGTIWIGDKSAKGYKREVFADAFERYLGGKKNSEVSVIPDSNRQIVKPVGRVSESSDLESVRETMADGSKNDTLPHAEKDSDILTDRNWEMRAHDVSSGPEEDAERFDCEGEDEDGERL